MVATAGLPEAGEIAIGETDAMPAPTPEAPQACPEVSLAKRESLLARSALAKQEAVVSTVTRSGFEAGLEIQAGYVVSGVRLRRRRGDGERFWSADGGDVLAHLLPGRASLVH